uniref:Putative LOV domain-containing protein n=1 Tax=Anemia tomentosa TaxID=148559 RepID=A0A126WXA2_9MONI|nr:putative LOV domain-containing protein [Anemia tomentosa]
MGLEIAFALRSLHNRREPIFAERSPPSPSEAQEEEAEHHQGAHTTTTTTTKKKAAGYRNCLGAWVMESLSSAYKESLTEALRKAQFNFVLTDPTLPDHPIVYASDGFLQMTGYSLEEVLGRNCRFLQGRGTDRRTVLQIRDAIREEKACQVAILNYTKQGKPFWNLFHMAPVYSREDGRVVHFVGVQTPIVRPSQPSDVETLQQGVDCCCPSPRSDGHVEGTLAVTVDPSPSSDGHVQRTLAVTVDVSARTSNADAGANISISASEEVMEDENCEVQEADNEKAKLSVKSIFCELATVCKGAGITEVRCASAAVAFGGEKLVCSSLMLSLTKVQQSFVLANPNLPDTPIVHASDLFLQLTGYTRAEVVGRNCRFLQGPKTDSSAVEQIRESLKAGKPCTVRLLNYRKDKTPFWNLLHIAPVRNSCGKISFYVGVQLDVTCAQEMCPDGCPTPHMKQLGAVGAVRVAVRSLQGEGLRRVTKNMQLEG